MKNLFHVIYINSLATGPNGAVVAAQTIYGTGSWFILTGYKLIALQ